MFSILLSTQRCHCSDYVAIRLTPTHTDIFLTAMRVIYFFGV